MYIYVYHYFLLSFLQSFYNFSKQVAIFYAITKKINESQQTSILELKQRTWRFLTYYNYKKNKKFCIWLSKMN